MSERKYTFDLDTGKILTGIVTVALLGFGKAAFDVYAFSKTGRHVTRKLQEYDERFLEIGSTLNDKADRVRMESVEKKVDKIITILCTMNNNRPQDCAK